MNSTSFFSELLTTIADRGRSVLPRSWVGTPIGARADLVQLARDLVSRRGEASGVALAREIFTRWDVLEASERREFLIHLVEEFGADTGQLEQAITSWRDDPSPNTLRQLGAAAEPKRQELIRRLNLAPGGTRRLVKLREEIARHEESYPALSALDADFQHLFSSWFNRGFLVLRRIDWSTPASILEKIIRYEAVHAIQDWDDLRRRIEPQDRRLFAFFHPQMVDEPLIFVEVALTTAIPGSIDLLLKEGEPQIAVEQATTAVFYSISNCQEGLRGVSFGNFLIKQVVEDLKRELPALKSSVTLSPVPGFAAWLARERASPSSDVLTAADRAALKPLDTADWPKAPAKLLDPLKEALLAAAAYYFLRAKTAKGRPVDAVARFHLGNGARLERMNFLGDRSAKGLAQSHGLMVNYLYVLDEIERNHETFAEKGTVASAAGVKAHLRAAAARAPRLPLLTGPASQPDKAAAAVLAEVTASKSKPWAVKPAAKTTAAVEPAKTKPAKG